MSTVIDKHFVASVGFFVLQNFSIEIRKFLLQCFNRRFFHENHVLRHHAAHFFERLLSETVSQKEGCDGPLTTLYSYDAAGRLQAKTEQYSEYGGEDRIYTWSFAEDGGYSVTEGQVEKRYDAFGSYLGQGDHTAYLYEYGYYDDGSPRYCIAYDPETGDELSSIAFDAHGNPTAVNGEDGVNLTVRNEYEEDRLVKQERYAADGTMLERTSYEYDEQGRLKRSIYVVPGASAAVTTSYTYGLVYLPEAES